MGKGSFYLAWIVFKYRSERERGLSLAYSHRMIETAKRYYDFIDTPGHRDMIKNFVKGVYLGDTAILVVSPRVSSWFPHDHDE